MHLDGDAYEHSNLVLATVLHMEGHPGSMVQKGAQVLWRYPVGGSTADQRSIAAKFSVGECRVEPLEFARCLRRIRGRMYDLLGSTSQPRSSS